MIIKELYITEFGGIKNKKIEFSANGVPNIIYGENESGKSTIFLFIKFMLYGLQRKSQTNTERERSLSWSGSTSAGSLTLVNNGKEYRIERSFSDRARGEKCDIWELESGERVATDKAPGEYFLGVPREVFESSACVGQMRSNEINGEKTAQSLSNMLSSADEGVDVAAVLKELNAVRVSYLHKNQGGGMLFDDEAKINALRMKLDEAKNASLAIEGKSEAFDKIKKEYEALRLELEKKDALVSQFNKIGIIRRFEALRIRESELNDVVGKKDVCAKSALTTEFFPDRNHIAELRAISRELAEKETLLDTRELKVADHRPNFDVELATLGERAEQSGGRDSMVVPLNVNMLKARSKVKLGGLLCGVAGGAAILSLIGFIAIGAIAGVAALGVAIALAVTGAIMLSKGITAKKKAINDFEALADRYNTTPDALGIRIDEAIKELARMREYNVEAAKLEAELDVAEEALESTKQRAYKLLTLTLGEDAEPDCETLDSEAERLNSFLNEYEALAREEETFLRMLESEKNALARYDEERLRQEITVNIEDATAEAVDEAERSKSFLLAKKNACESRITLLQNELISLRIKAEDPMPIADRLAALEEKNQKDREFYNALILAMETIEDSSSSMRGNVTPIISKMAGDILARISNDKYSVLRTNSRLGVMLDKDGFAVGSEFLSAGTRDTAYIALRIAIIMQIFSGERPPIIFDESFCQLDDTRLFKTVELLCSLAKEGIQIIMFTSHKREAEACQRAGLEYNRIVL